MADFISEWIPDIIFISSGLLINIQYTLISVFIGLCLAVLLSVAKVSKYRASRCFADGYTSIFRGTPLIIQLSITYYILPSLLGIKLGVFSATIISLSLNSAAYVSEILRGGINAVDHGQFEASWALGLSKYQTYKDIILPQAIRKIFPSLVNEVVNMLKETSIISIIGEAEILRRAQLVAGQKYNYTVPLMTSALSYYFVILILVWFANHLEKKLAL
ncbi:MAG: amino acid ABC transporter permease [Rickettsiaceae bacterium]|nr:amino acid ABC transporter permease [Rickettsiaceae bacterium]